MTHQRSVLRAAALAAAARGWHVFPLVPGMKKQPALRQWESQSSTNFDQIDRAWSVQAWNIGLATGPSGLVVLDLDTLKSDQTVPEPWRHRGIIDGTGVLAALAAEGGHAEVPSTYTVATPRGGRHLYFTAPTDVELRITAGDRGQGLGWHIDTRAGGGYVVAAGSVTHDGTYAVVDDRPPVALPNWIGEKLRPAPLPPQKPTPVALVTGRRARYINAAMSAELRRVEQATEGHRNAALYIAACALGQLAAGGALSESDVVETLLHAAQDHVAAGAYRWTDARKTIASGLKAGGTRPRSVAA